MTSRSGSAAMISLSVVRTEALSSTMRTRILFEPEAGIRILTGAGIRQAQPGVRELSYRSWTPNAQEGDNRQGANATQVAQLPPPDPLYRNKSEHCAGR